VPIPVLARSLHGTLDSRSAFGLEQPREACPPPIAPAQVLEHVPWPSLRGFGDSIAFFSFHGPRR